MGKKKIIFLPASDYACTEADLSTISIPAHLTYDGVFKIRDDGTLR